MIASGPDVDGWRDTVFGHSDTVENRVTAARALG